MKSHIIHIFLLLSAMLSCIVANAEGRYGESSEHNYVTMATLTQPTDSISTVASVPSRVSVAYFDGFGRKVQTIVHDNTTQQSLVDLTEYDMRGNPVRQWIPTTSEGVEFTDLDGLRDAYASINYGSPNSNYAITEYHAEPQVRVKQTRRAGAEWHAASAIGVTTTYGINTVSGSLACRYWTISNSGKLRLNGLWQPGELRVTTTTDEDGRSLMLFVDHTGKTILERRFNGAEQIDTYYVYDHYGNLRYVIPPKACASLSSQTEYSDTHTVLSSLCYIYKYDYRNRLISKKLPGMGAQYFAYDRADRLTYSQDAEQRNDGNKASFMLYDRYGREVMSGLTVSLSAGLQAIADTLRYSLPQSTFKLNDSTAPFGYTLSLSNIDATGVMNVNYYDDYSYLSLYEEHADSLEYMSRQGYGVRKDGATSQMTSKSMLTGTATRVIGSDLMLVTAYYYDIHGNIIQQRSNNHLGGYDVYYRSFSFDNLLLGELHSHSDADGSSHLIQKDYSYDNMGRLLSTTSSIDGRVSTTLSTNDYDSLGRLQSVVYPQNCTTIDYDYNLHGWVTEIDSPYFSQQLYYATRPDSSEGYLNGNISAQTFSVSQGTGSTSTSRLTATYNYTYDSLDRLKTADYTEHSRLLPPSLAIGPSHVYDTPQYSTSYYYDANSNPTRILRKGFVGTTSSTSASGVTAITHQYGYTDVLGISLDGNRIKKVRDNIDYDPVSGATDFSDGVDASIEYTYDDNGRLTSDLNKGITQIRYNHLNLPEEIRFSDGHIVDYQYDAAGRRLGAYYLLASDDVFNDGIGVEGGGVSIQELVREWSGEFVYENGELERILTDNGYWKNGRYWFYIKDRQGNNRVTVGGISDASATPSGGMSLNPTVTLLQAKDVNVYYPYGTRFSDVFATTTDRYQYSGKEFDRMNGLDLYDFHARQYDPVLGRFTTPDPLSEKYYHISPYAYCASNPLRYIDPTGKVLIFVNGMHFGDGGTSEYWNGLDKKIMSMLNDNKSIYYDGSGGGVFNTLLTGVVTGNLNPYRRMAYGSTKGYSAAAEIISNLGDGETIKFITHSMGAAYCKGFISGMQKYASEKGINLSDKIDFELDLAPFQPEHQKANSSVKTMTISHYGDIIAGHNPIEGAKNNTTKCSPENSVLLKEHSISSFTHDEINRVLQKDNKSTD